jgi:acyl dehydratase
MIFSDPENQVRFVSPVKLGARLFMWLPWGKGKAEGC